MNTRKLEIKQRQRHFNFLGGILGKFEEFKGNLGKFGEILGKKLPLIQRIIFGKWRKTIKFSCFNNLKQKRK